MALIRCASDDVMPQIVVDSTRACIAYRVVWRKTAEEWLNMTVIVIAFIMSSFHSPDTRTHFINRDECEQGDSGCSARCRRAAKAGALASGAT
jgi:hypothetical protein